MTWTAINKVPAKTFFWIVSHVRLQFDNFLIASFPKTGSTWIRYFLYNYLCRSHPHLPTSLDSMNLYMPELGNRSILKTWKFRETPPLLKTHARRNHLIRSKNTVLLIRNPAATLQSLTNYLNGQAGRTTTTSLHEVIHSAHYGARSFMQHYSSWREHCSGIFKYEDFVEQPDHAFTRLLSVLGIALPPDELKKVIALSSLHNMRKAEQASINHREGLRPNYSFIRKKAAQTSGYTLSEDDMSYIDKLSTEYGFNEYDRTSNLSI